jgi:hypothetical protein
MKYLFLFLLAITAQAAEFNTQTYWNLIFLDKKSDCVKLCDLSSYELVDEAVRENTVLCGGTHVSGTPYTFDQDIVKIRDFKNKCHKQCKLHKKVKPRHGRQKRPVETK